MMRKPRLQTAAVALVLSVAAAALVCTTASAAVVPVRDIPKVYRGTTHMTSTQARLGRDPAMEARVADERAFEDERLTAYGEKAAEACAKGALIALASRVLGGGTIFAWNTLWGAFVGCMEQRYGAAAKVAEALGNAVAGNWTDAAVGFADATRPSTRAMADWLYARAAYY